MIAQLVSVKASCPCRGRTCPSTDCSVASTSRRDFEGKTPTPKEGSKFEKIYTSQYLRACLVAVSSFACNRVPALRGCCGHGSPSARKHHGVQSHSGRHPGRRPREGVCLLAAYLDCVCVCVCVRVCVVCPFVFADAPTNACPPPWL